MADLTLVAGECGRGSGTYDTGLFTMPLGCRGVETVADIVLLGGVEEKPSMMVQVLASLKTSTALQGGLALAQTVDPTSAVALATTVVSTGLGAVDGSPRQKVVVEVRFTDGASLVALAEVGVAALIENDRRVVLRAVPRLRSSPAQPVADEEGASRLGQAVGAAGSAVANAAAGAGSAVSSAFGFVKARTIG